MVRCSRGAASRFWCKFSALASGSFLLRRKAMLVKCGVSVEGVQRAWWAPLNQTSGLQGHSGGGWGDLAGNDLGTGSGWKQSRQNQTPLCSDETRSPSTTASLRAALAATLHLSFVLLTLGPCGRLCSRVKGPAGLMDKASASGAGDSRFESWAGHAASLLSSK